MADTDLLHAWHCERLAEPADMLKEERGRNLEQAPQYSMSRLPPWRGDIATPPLSPLWRACGAGEGRAGRGARSGAPRGYTGGCARTGQGG